MVKKALFEPNPHLQYPEDCRVALITNVSSSTAVETGEPVQVVAEKLIKMAHRLSQPIIYPSKYCRDISFINAHALFELRSIQILDLPTWLSMA
ncbi:MAG TPA: hypothetical protein VIH66_00185 [Gammaproteobacteria bacterium]